MSIEELIMYAQEILQNPFFVKYGLAGLAANGVLASTVVPIPTEITVSALIGSGYDKLVVFGVLTASTYAGGFVNYWLGRSGNKLFSFLKGKQKKQDETKTEGLLKKYGWIAIAGSSWIPVIGDFIPIVAGSKKYDLRKFALALLIAKASRSIVIVYFSSLLIQRIFG